jgi:uncharacterized membrane protein YqhA
VAFTINDHLAALVLSTIGLFMVGNLAVVSMFSLYDISISPRPMAWQMW